MLTKEKLDNLVPNTVEKRIILLLYKQYNGIAKINNVCADLSIEKRVLIGTHVRKSPYLEHKKDLDCIRLARKGKDIHSAGYCDEISDCSSIAQYVFTILYNSENAISFENSCAMVRGFCELNNLPIGDYCNSRTKHYSYYKKLVRKWLVATGRIEEGI